MFENSVDHEFHSPPKYGNVALDVNDFEYALGGDFVNRYHRRETEYKVPIANRIYCKRMIREDHKLPAGASRTTDITLGEADVEMCRRLGIPLVECGAIHHSQPAGTKLTCHSCGGETICTDNVEDSATLDQQQQRGVEFRCCPTCQTNGYLHEACNRIECRCGTIYCYLCATVLDASNRDHFVNKCPRFGQPDSERAIFDGDRDNEAFLDFMEDEADMDLALLDLLIGIAVVEGPDGLAAQALRDMIEGANGMAAQVFPPLQAPQMPPALEFGPAPPSTSATQFRETARDDEEEAAILAEVRVFSHSVGVRSHMELMLGLMDVPAALRLQRARVLGVDRELLEARRLPVSSLERAFISEHLSLVGLMNRVGEHRLRERLPRTHRAFMRYLDELHLPEDIEGALQRNLAQARRNARV